MKSLAALIQREYFEHRGAFLYAPLVILGLFALVMVSALGFDRVGPRGFEGSITSIKLFELAYLFTSALWFAYLLISLFFYYADAFNADRRNNAMLFWKSMPVSDFKVLGAKMLAGGTIFPALIVGAMVVGMVIATGVATIAVFKAPLPVLPDFGALLGAATQVLVFDLAFIVLGLLWYAPFFAWVGMLSTLAGRWSIPLAFLVPGMVGLFENAILDLQGPRGGYVLSYLRSRIEFIQHDGMFEAQLFSLKPFDAIAQISSIVVGIDWGQMIGGLAVATLLVWLASEYRRRMIAA
jgi:ABC-2 type transport system permease protein